MLELLILLIILAAMGGMRGRGFTRRLKRELPKWVEAGLVEPEKAPLILDHVAAGSSRHSLATMFGILGAILLGIGAITFFAAHWQGMPKLLKLIVLFGAMWAAFIAAGWAKSGERGWLCESMLLLGVLLFGANIMLIAQIYHIDAHYPDGVMVWALGGLLVAWLLRSPAVFVAGLLLAMLWSGMESIDFSRLHWPFLLVLAGFTVLGVREGWARFAHLLMVALLLWSVSAYVHFVSDYRTAGVVYLTQIFFLVYLGLFIASMHLEISGRFADWAETMRHYAATATLFALWALTFPDLLTAKFYLSGHQTLRPAADAGWLTVTLVMLAIVAALALWHRQRMLRAEGRLEHWLMWGQGILLLVLGCLLVNLFVPGSHGSQMAIAFNAVFFAGSLWLVYAGMHLDSRHLVNLGFMFFALGVLSRYFDFFWKLLDRSFFFMAGGLLLIAVAAVLDQKRRRIMDEMMTGGAA